MNQGGKGKEKRTKRPQITGNLTPVLKLMFIKEVITV